MRKPLLLLAMLAAGCQKDADLAPDAELAADEVEIITQGRNGDCGVAQVVAIDPAQVRRVIGSSGYEPTYLAFKLDTALWVRKSHRLYVRIRKPESNEYVICHAFGPGYAPFTVVSARIKPGSK